MKNSLEKRGAVVDGFLGSGLSTGMFCKENGVHLCSSNRWLKDCMCLTQQGVPIFDFKAQFVTRNAKRYLPNKHTVKDLRTTFATYCNEIGIDTKIIQKWMGHSTDTMTKQRYIKIQEDYEVSEMKKLDKFFPNFFPKIKH